MPRMRKEVLYFKDFSSGAMIENIVARAKKDAIKQFLATGEEGIKFEHLLESAREEFRENEDLPNTTNPDDWARISGKKGERIVFMRTLIQDAHGGEAGRGRAVAGRGAQGAWHGQRRRGVHQGRGELRPGRAAQHRRVRPPHHVAA